MKTAIYLRQSLDRDQTKLAVDRQRDDLLKLCERKVWDDPVEYCDNNVSATKGRRPAYDDLCRDIAGGVINRVAVWDMDRLHRQPAELEDFITLADKYGVELANVGGDVDLSTPAGRYFARTRGAAARFEVEHKAERQKVANRQRAHAGKAWVQRTFGYDGDEVVEHEAEAIRKACHALLNGAKLYGMAQEGNSAGLRTAKGNTWTGGTVRQVLSRARNAGLQIYDGVVIEGVQTAWPAIVERDVWEAVCAVLADPKRHTGKSPGRKHLLSGLAICGVCGKPMGTTVRKTGGGNRAVYQCKRIGCMKIVRDLVQTDELLVGTKVGTKWEPGIVTRRLAEPDAAVTLARPTVDTAALRDKITTLRAQIAEAEADYDDGQITAARMNARIDRVNAKLGPLEEKLLGANTARVLDGLAGHADAAERFAALPLDRRRAVIDTIARITIHTQRKGGRFDPAAITLDWR